MENGRCKFHGGMTPHGPAHPAFKTGRYSKYLPNDLLKKYGEALESSELQDLNDELALVTARLFEMVSGLKVGSAEAWGEALTAFKQMDAAIRRQDQAEAGRWLTALGKILESGAGTSDAWLEIRETIQDKRRLTETIAKQELMGQVSMDRVLTLYIGMSHIVARYVPDRQTCALISRDWKELLMGGKFSTPKEAVQLIVGESKAEAKGE